MAGDGPDKLRSLIKRLREIEGGAHRRSMLEAVGAEMLARTKMGFARERDPYGEPWAPVFRHGRPLRDTGRLQNSFHLFFGSARVMIGSNVEYGLFHQHGFKTRLGKGKHLPKPGRKAFVVARPMLPDERGLPDAWRSSLTRILSQLLTRLASGHS